MKPFSAKRRRFLGTLPAGAALLLGAREAFASRLSSLAPGLSPQQLRSQYTLSPDVTYFNHGSIGTVPRLVQQAHSRYARVCEQNPWLYMWGGEWEEPREVVRAKAAALLGARPEELAITHNTTEGFNTLAAGLDLGAGDEVLFSSLNHPGASICWRHYARRRGFTVRQFDFPLDRVPGLSREGVVQLHADQIASRTRVLVFPHIDNMVGLRHPMRELALEARARGVEFVAVDGAQSLGMIPVDLQGSGVDFYAASPHKWLQSPKGLGLLYVRREALPKLRPMWVTWGQERWKGTARIYEDYGTRNLPELLALGDAIDFHRRLEAGRRERRLRALRDAVKGRVEDSSRLVWRSPARWELGASLYSVEARGVSSRDLFQSLNERRGFVFRAFDQPGFNASRLSLNLVNDQEQIDRFVEAAEAV